LRVVAGRAVSIGDTPEAAGLVLGLARSSV
jgi:hypothetical protein